MSRPRRTPSSRSVASHTVPDLQGNPVASHTVPDLQGNPVASHIVPDLQGSPVAGPRRGRPGGIRG